MYLYICACCYRSPNACRFFLLLLSFAFVDVLFYVQIKLLNFFFKFFFSFALFFALHISLFFMQTKSILSATICAKEVEGAKRTHIQVVLPVYISQCLSKNSKDGLRISNADGVQLNCSTPLKLVIEMDCCKQQRRQQKTAYQLLFM